MAFFGKGIASLNQKLPGAIPQILPQAQGLSATSTNTTTTNGAIPNAIPGATTQSSNGTSTQGVSSTTAKTGTTTAATGAIPPVAPGTPESAQAWINNSASGYGGMSAYQAKQQGRYDDAYAAKDQGLIDRLNADQARVGYKLTIPKAFSAEGDAGSIPPIDPSTMSPEQWMAYFKSIAEAESAQGLADKTRIAGLQKDSLTSAYNRANQITQDGRTLENLWLDRNNNPFSGQYDDLKYRTTRERGLSDEAARSNYDSAIAGIDQGLADYQNTAAQSVLSRAYQLGQDYANMTGNFMGGRTLAGQEFDQNKQNQAFNQLLATATFDYQKARDAITDKQYQQKFDEDVRQHDLNYAIQQASLNHQISNDAIQNAISKQNANTSAYSAETSRLNYGLNKDQFDWTKDPKNPANQTAGATAEKYASYIDGSPTAFTKDADGNPTQNNQVIESMILSSGLSPTEMTKLYQRYGIPMK